MSPEQARALKVDERTDIFSLGVVLYEMITGRVPFDGATSSDVLAAILEKNPLALRTYGDFPDELQWIVTKALAKDPEERYQMAKDLLTDLKRVRKQIEIAEELKRSDSSLTIKTSVISRSARYLKFFALAVLVLIAGVVAIEMARRRPPAQVIERRLIQKQITFSGTAFNAEISPDGKFLSYCEPKGVFVQSLSGGNPLPVSSSEIVYNTRWSPNGSQLLIVTADKQLRGIAVSPFGGQPRPISPIGTIVSWSPDSTRVASTRVSRKYIEITSLRENKKVSTINIRLPIPFIWIDDLHWSAAGRFALLVRTDTQNLIATLKDDGSQPMIVVNEALNNIGRRLRWSWDGKSIYYWKEGKEGQSDLMKIEISPETGKAVANPKLILSDPAFVSGLSFSNNGILAFTRNLYRSNIWSFHLDDSNQKWTKSPLTQGTWVASFPSISPDGKTVAFDLTKRGERSIFSVSSSGGEIHQLTYDTLCYRPTWSPSGKTIAAVCDYGGVLNVVLISPDGSILKRFDSTKVSQTRFVRWASDNSILYQLPGNRNFNFLNTDSGKENPLLTDTSRGWMFDPIVSRDQKKAIFEVNWQEKNLIGIWLENLSNHTGSILVPGRPMQGNTPIAWSADSEWVYFWRRSNDNPEDIISKIHVDTKKEFPLPLLDIGEDQSIDWISIAQDEKTFVVSLGEYESDVWIVENFDPK
jgi:Tol biopolymer transport system component